MALNTVQQIQDAITKSTNILVVFRKKFDVDTVAGACALALFLKKMNKAVEVVASDFHLPENLAFLPYASSIQGKLGEMQKLVISLDLKDKEIDQLSYEVKNGQLSIFIAPKKGVLEKDSVKTEMSGLKYDLIIVLDTPDLESLGKLHDDNTELFQTRPMINIDYHPSNENFGQILFHNLAAGSMAEILFGLFSQIYKEHIDSEIAMCLLAGLIAKTKSFTAPNVTPQTLQLAKTLIELEADRNLIIKNLYRNKTLAVVNLWGRVLARLRFDETTRLSWSLIPEYDFIDTSTTEKNLEGVVEEFIRDIPHIEIFILFFQKGQNSHVHIYSLAQHDAMWLGQNHKAEGTRQFATLTLLHTPLVEAEKKITEEVKNLLKQSSRRD